MKGNVFSDWLKEFCALVFTQTVQAFILAIVLTLVIMSVIAVNESGYTAVTQNQAGGVLAIIALTAISKIEDLVKKLFGLHSSITDSSMKGGKGGLLGSIAAMKMAKNMLNNASKFAKGVSGRIKSNKDIRALKLSTYNKLNKLDTKSGVTNSGTSMNSPSSSNNTILNSAQERLDELKPEGFGPGDREYDSALNDLNSVKSKLSTTNSTTKSSNSNDKNEEKREKIKENYDNKLRELKAAKKKASREMLSGITETVGGITVGGIGAAAGAVAAAGMGEDILSYTTKGAGIGMGVGDKLGNKAAFVVSPALTPKIVSEEIHETVKLYSKENRNKIKEIEKKMKNFNVGDI